MPKGNPNPKRENLKVQPTKWKHLPTKAVRVPELFEKQVVELALELDSGKLPENELGLGLEQYDTAESLYETLRSLSLTDLLKIQLELPLIIEQRKEETRDRRLEQAILFLTERCDGASTWDGQGFNKVDAGFGRWLWARIEAKQPLIKSHAESALKMLTKYKGQLERGGLSLPQWEEIEHQYPETHRLRAPDEELPAHRIEVKGNKVAVYAPYDSTGRFQKTAKSIEGYAFSNSDKGWYFPIEKVEEVLEAFKDGYDIDPNLEGALAMLKQQQEEELATKEQEALEKSSEIIRLIHAANLDAPLANGWYLRDYQKRGVEWLLAHRQGGIYRGGILADDMGLGKSLTTLVAARAMQRTFDCPVFVIAPVSVLDNWMREAARAHVKIETFSWAKLPLPLETSKYVLISDESHYMQNSEAQRTKKALELAKHENCLAAWLLTGTPIKNGRPINLYPLLDAVGHKLAADKWGYQKYFCAAHHDHFGKKSVWVNTGAAHLDELAKKTEDVILRRTKQECLTELPPKTRLYKQAELDPRAATAYSKEIQRLVEDYRQRAKDGKVDADAEALVTLNILRRVGSEAKVNAAITLAQELLEQGQQVVLFTEFVESARSIHEALGGELLTGESKDRQAMIDRFQSGESKIFVGTIKAGGVGITLTAASNVILVDRAWSPGDCDQAEDRCNRLGQQNAVFATWLQLGDIDKAIDSLLLSKQERIELVLKGKRKTLRGLDSPKDLAKELLAIL